MRRLTLALAACLAAGLLVFLWVDGPQSLAARAMEAQRTAQNAMAGALRALRSGEAGALAALLALSFGYGVAHAAGPGHGKLVIGAYGLSGRVRLPRLAAVAVLASLAQATTAVALVYAGVFLFDLTREQLGDIADRRMMQASALAIGAIGLLLAFRGLRRLWRAGSVQAHDHAHGADCGCGHAHGPDPLAVEAAASARELALLIGAVALRPCTGALFLLVLTWRMGIGAAGIAGAYVMGLGTAVVTLGAAVAATTLREGALAALGRGEGRLARALPVAELVAGVLVATLAWAMLAPA